MVSRPHRRRAAKGERLREWRKRALPRCQRIERPCSRISWLLGRRGLWRPFRKPSRDADAMKHAELRADRRKKRVEMSLDAAGRSARATQVLVAQASA